MRPVKLTMQAFGSYGNLTQIDFQEPDQNLLTPLYLRFTEKQVPVLIRRMVLYFRASM